VGVLFVLQGAVKVQFNGHGRRPGHGINRGSSTPGSQAQSAQTRVLLAGAGDVVTWDASSADGLPHIYAASTDPKAKPGE
jgi:hypothetical protein